jgi:hypothetical protein
MGREVHGEYHCFLESCALLPISSTGRATSHSSLAFVQEPGLPMAQVDLVKESSFALSAPVACS